MDCHEGGPPLVARSVVFVNREAPRGPVGESWTSACSPNSSSARRASSRSTSRGSTSARRASCTSPGTTRDISNPFLPREVGYYISPKYEGPDRIGRHSREVYQDPETGLIYMTDGNGGGVTVLKWKGKIPPNPPIPGAR